MRSHSGHTLFLIITIIITLLPLLFGVFTWNRLPESIAIHFGLDGKPNSWAPKWVAVFALPLLLLVVQLIVFFSMGFASTQGAIGTWVYRVSLLIVPLCAIVCAVVIYGKALK